jgi:hypothetical protein
MLSVIALLVTSEFIGRIVESYSTNRGTIAVVELLTPV